MTSRYGGNYTKALSDKAASRLGQVSVHPKDNELFLDIDSDADFAVFKEHYEMLDSVVHKFRVKKSKSGGEHKHIVVTLKRNVSSHMERFALQCFLGSDRKHEVHSYLSMLAGHPNPTMFFENK